MTTSTFIRDKVNKIIDKWGSTIIITPRTYTKGSYGGYEGRTTTEGTAVTTVAIESNYLKRKSGMNAGRIAEGDLTLGLKYDEVVTEDSKITWDSNEYKVKEIKEIKPQNTVIYIRITLTKMI